MKKILFFIGILLSSFSAFTQTSTTENLYGTIEKNNLQAAPYDKWFTTGYDSYQPATETIRAIKKLDTKGITIEIFLGTWCGDSKPEVPRFLKLLDDVSFSQKNIKIIGVGNTDSMMKQSPGHEEAGKGVFRVPVFIISKNGVEINRINEFPVYSLEKDLQMILSNQSYSPNYRTFATVRTWLADGVLLDKNNNTRGLALQLQTLAASERELNSLGYLLLTQSKKQEALRIFQINANLYPESANVLSSLGEAYSKTGDTKNAIQFLERSLELNKDPLLVKEILKILYKAKGIE